MFIAYCVLAIVYSGMLIVSGIVKLQHNPQAVQIIHERIGVPSSFSRCSPPASSQERWACWRVFAGHVSASPRRSVS